MMKVTKLLEKPTWSGIGHGQEEWLAVLDLKVFVFKLFAVDRFAPRAIASREVTTLKHESLDDAMKN